MKSPTESNMVKMLKKVGMKQAMERRKVSGERARTVMCQEHSRVMVKKLFRKPTYRVNPANQHFLVQ